ncbi:carbohydrate ABC transporter substrate-binding protein, CUT1 family [Cognatiyoonia koreensis]|uniref:Carbohydrate ABC transporter substrate-binding protein, CUT1 family n=1 Tax=Cognatiyoonia koreensis TaxID=364200 RepID=A0A1I0QGT0_9RHOB|nr:sugar ABC transporter substrate-binding protein [Cognatiyoonia koreensis]SEW26326.1 carbohydrate ABC transporter substrate-binding protein, CUT1 family [Cognatiyoonia koreensis]
MKNLSSTIAIAASLWGAQALAWEATEGRPFEGQTVNVLAVKSSQFEAHEARLAEFEEATGIDVVYDYVPFPNMKEALTTEMVAGGDYDVVSVMDQWVVSLQNLMTPIGPGIEAQGTDLSDFPAAHLRHGMLDGELIGLPVRGHVQLLFYRPDLLEAAGVNPPQTWEEMVTVAKAVQDNTDAAGIALPYGKLNGQNLMVWMNLLWGNGGDLFDADGSPAFNSDAGVAATQTYVGYIGEEIVPAGSAVFVEQDAVNSFKQGNSAMLPVWWWVRSQLTDPEQSTLTADQVAFTSLPSVDGADRTTYTNTWIFGVTQESDAKDAATEFLGWLTDPALEREVLLDPDLSEVVAVHMSNLTDPEVNERWGGMHQAAADALATAEGVEFGDDWPRIALILETAISSLASGEESDVQAALDKAAEEIAAIR